MSEPAVALAFFDPDRGLHGSARSGVTLLFQHGQPQALPEGPEVGRDGELLLQPCDGSTQRIIVRLQP